MLRCFRHWISTTSLAVAVIAVCSLAGPNDAPAAEPQAEQQPAKPGTKGQRLATAGHSFLMFVPAILSDIAEQAGIENHQQVARQGIGGSYVYQHWDRPAEQNSIKQALEAAQVDVLTLSPIYLPDDGIENFARLALKHNPEVQVAVQEFWLPFDVYDKNYKKKRPTAVDRNARTAAEIRAQHAGYFKDMDEHVRSLNKELGKRVVCVVPAGQAVVLLREKIIAGEAPGLKEQNDLFRDAIGHPTAPLQALVAYCHFATIYRRSPVGLAVPKVLSGREDSAQTAALNKLLQQLAWQAVCEHPLSGGMLAKQP